MSVLETTLCSQLSIESPIVQAPIGSVTCPELAAAVSNAGGLGMLAVTWRDIDETRAVVRETRNRTDEPFGVNLVLDPETAEIPTEEHLNVCLDAGVPIVSLSFGAAKPYVERIHEAEATVMQSVGSAAAARAAVDAGVDVIVAQGWEAGGHIQSEVATLPLVPRVVDAVPETPVIAAGEIADGRGIAAVLTLGAAGAWLGTRFVATNEAAAHEQYKQRITEATETETAHTELFDKGWPGTPHRTLRNSTIAQWEQAERPPPGQRPNETEKIAESASGKPLERYGDDPPLPDTQGNVEAMALYTGQSAGLVNGLPAADTVVNGLTAEAINAIETMAETAPGSQS
ncbi:NAD(P)H-dependent flavin oxidoreductase [Saliphagus infecundisoli]|uniref:NAD(P)H-dependent flavin oxidoreductase n=1 Tax=Saliphagus infecundisoli TaxID=1849069 RepID=A0ABD5QCI7_9EURY|nr:nitronate monooxygenase [Saliphagus infecundisoli]